MRAVNGRTDKRAKGRQEKVRRLKTRGRDKEPGRHV
jgi:hypothetical protein